MCVPGASTHPRTPRICRVCHGNLLFLAPAALFPLLRRNISFRRCLSRCHQTGNLTSSFTACHHPSLSVRPLIPISSTCLHVSRRLSQKALANDDQSEHLQAPGHVRTIAGATLSADLWRAGHYHHDTDREWWGLFKAAHAAVRLVAFNPRR